MGLISFKYIYLFLFLGFVPHWADAAESFTVLDDPEFPQVWDIEFEGNRQYADVILKDQILTDDPTFLEKLRFWNRSGHALDKTELKKDVIRIRNYYQRRGYVNVEVSHKVETGNKEWKRKVTFQIEENIPIRIRNVSYELHSNGNGVPQIREHPDYRKAQREHSYQENTRYETLKEPEVIGLFTDVFKNMGYAYAEVDIQAEIDSTQLTADLTIQGHLGPKTYIDSLRIEGNENMEEYYILRETDLSRGEEYSLEKLQNAQQELFNHHMFRFATISIPEQAKDTTLDLVMRVRENEQRSVELMGGFGTEDKLRGQVSWTHRNVGHRGHELDIIARSSFIEQYLTLSYLFPYVYNTKSSFVISPFGQHLLEDNFELLRGGITNSFIYRYTDDFTASASYEYTKNKELSKRFDASLPDTTLAYDLSSFKLSSYFSQGFGREQEGWVLQPYFELSGLFGLASFQFQKATADIRRFSQLSNSTMVAARVQGGGLFNAPTDSLPNNIRFYLGGTNSVRGWYRHQLGPKRARTDSTGFLEYVPRGGRAMLGFNVEIRQELNFLINGLGMAVFLDGGQIWETFRQLDTRPLQYGFGGGLRYESPIGPVRVDIGYKINPMDEDLDRYNGRDYGSAWDRIGIHFSIGQAF